MNTLQREQHWAAFERPQVMREFVHAGSAGHPVADLLIQGVHCAACTWRIETALKKQPGVRSIEVNPLTTRAELSWDPDQVGLAALLKRIADLGFNPVPFTGRATHDAAEQERRSAMRRLLVAGLGMMQVTSYAIALYAGAFQGMDPEIEAFLRLISLLVATPIVVYSGAPFFRGAWRNITTRHPGMDLPIALAIGGAWAASVWNTFSGSGEVYFDSATMFVFFLSGTRYLEAAGRYRALDLTNSLAQQLPCTAIRIRTGSDAAACQEEVGVMELEHGDTVLVPMGIAFPADGTLLSPSAEVDEAMLTGESLPVTRQLGDAVVAGTVNAGEAVLVQVSTTGADTVLGQIARLVTQAGRDRPPLVEMTDRIASVFVMAVIALATLAGAVWWQIAPERTFEIMLSLLVVTCPCALALATPAAFTVATSRLARDGFLVRRAGALQRLAAATHAVFDKTGTLTENRLRIAAVHAADPSARSNALQIAAALEAESAHPIARAFRAITTPHAALRLRSSPGGGLAGEIAGQAYRIGTLDFATGEHGAAPPAWLPDVASAELRSIYLAGPDGLLARFDIAETLREGAAAAIAGLADLGIATTIASGDQPRPVAALAATVGVSDWQAALLPGDKLARVRQLQSAGATVVAVGDGVNDSPVLAGADVSIAMGSGASSAQHTADCVWLGNQLTGFDRPFALARKTMRIIKQNLAWALAYNLLAIPLAAAGYLQPWMAALGMSLSSLLVMLNALRLSRGRLPAGAVAAAADTDTRRP
ncbi:MAG: cation-translocating P-type ATPase, partial [Gammaproteobacteria bacterium]|nr:cation-translocating P-type ATPase [Gammaproteobacteria bacterium]